MPLIHMLWSSLIVVGVSIYLLFVQLGPSSFAGLAVLILLIPANALLIKKRVGYQRQMLTNKDKRVKIMNEVLQG